MSASSQRWVISLLLLNIVLTLVVLLRQEPVTDAQGSETSVSLSREMVAPYGQRVVDAYNSGNVDRLYALYHGAAKAKLTRQEVADQLQRLQELFGTVERISYLNNIRLGEKGGESYYQAHFTAHVANQSLDQAQLVLHLVREGDSLSLYGMRLNAAQP